MNGYWATEKGQHRTSAAAAEAACGAAVKDLLQAQWHHAAGGRTPLDKPCGGTEMQSALLLTSLC